MPRNYQYAMTIVAAVLTVVLIEFNRARVYSYCCNVGSQEISVDLWEFKADGAMTTEWCTMHIWSGTCLDEHGVYWGMVG